MKHLKPSDLFRILRSLSRSTSGRLAACLAFAATTVALPAQAPGAPDSLHLAASATEHYDTLPAPHLLTVDELFELGVRNSLRLEASRQEIEIAADRVKNARTGYYPAVTASINAGYAGNPTLFRRGLKNASASDIPNWQQQYALELSQPLFTGGRLRRNVEKTEIRQKIAALALHAERADVKLSLLSYYLDLFDLYQQRAVLQKNIEQAERRLHDIRQMRREGMITRNDVIRTELELSGYRLARQETQDRIGLLSQQLDIALGLDESWQLLPDTAFLHADRPLLTYEAYLTAAYRQAPGLGISRLNVTLAENGIRLARTAYLPDLSLHAGNTLARPVTRVSPVQDLFVNNWNVALVLSYRLSAFYHDKYQVSAARRQAAADRTREELQKQQIRVNIRSAFVRHRESLDRIRTLTGNVEQAEENYRIVQNKYLNQLAILTDLLDAARVRLDAELQLTSARTEAIYTYYQLLHDTGEL